ncbi:MAG: aminotransferase class I/II-fold pyridoxal phosphate-dependent enzyme, partial [Myxococcota bacterium]
DDYDHEYHYEGPPVAPMIAADRAGVVVSIGTLSKAFAPGLRMGWVLAPPPVVERLVDWRLLVDRQGDQIMEYAVAELLRDGVLGRHLRKTRRIYAQRRQVLRDALARSLPALHPADRPGGLALWCRVERSAGQVEAWAARCRAHDVHFETAVAYTLDGAPRPFVRLGFACHDAGELRESVRRMTAAWTG